MNTASQCSTCLFNIPVYHSVSRVTDFSPLSDLLLLVCQRNIALWQPFLSGGRTL